MSVSNNGLAGDKPTSKNIPPPTVTKKPRGKEPVDFSKAGRGKGIAPKPKKKR